jgi:putative polyhydroxyalkanoate system protein
MSKPVTVTIPHELGRAEARRRIEAGFDDLSRHLGGMGGVSKAWDGDRLNFAFAAMGQAISGTAEVADQAVRLEVLLPNLLAMMAGKLTGRLRKEGQLLLEKK